MSQPLEIVGIVSGPPWTAGDDPAWLLVQGRAAAGIASVEVQLRSDVSGTLLASGTTTVQPGSPATWGLRIEAPDFGLQLFCGRRFVVEALGLDAGGTTVAGSMVSGTHALACKPPPPGQAPTGGGAPSGGDVDDGGGWPWPWPPLPCPASADAYVVALVIALWLLVAAIAVPGAALLAASGAALLMALVYRAAWLQCAGPGPCARWSRALWCFKQGLLGGLVIAIAALNPAAMVPVLGYAVTAGLLTVRLTAAGCRLPRAVSPPSALPYA